MKSKKVTISYVAMMIIMAVLTESFLFSNSVLGQEPIGSDTTGTWAEFRGNVNNTGYSISNVPSGNRTFLELDTGWAFHSSPVVYDGILYFGSDSGQIFAINVSTGREVWNYTTSSEIWASPLVIGDKVFIGSMDYNLYALDARNGSHLWTFRANDSIASSAKYTNGIIIFASYDGNVYFVNSTNGLQIYSPFSTGGQIWGTPAIVDDTVIIGSNDGNIYRIYLGNNTIMWNFTLTPEPSGFVKFSSPAVYGNSVFIGSSDYNAYSLDFQTGNLIWKFQSGNYIYASPAIHEDKVFVHSTDGNLYALPFNDPNFDKNITLQEVLWQFFTDDGGGGEGGSSPAVVNGNVLVASRPGHIYCIDEITGLEVWKFSTPRSNKPSFSSPAIVDGRVYVGASDGVMYGFAELIPGLEVDIIFGAPSIIIESERAFEIVFNVTYLDLPVEGAFITFTVSAGILSQYGASTLADGKQKVKYLAPKVTENTTVVITATASKYGMEIATSAITITVVPAPGYETESGSAFSLEKYLFMFIVIIILAIVNGFIYSLILIKRIRGRSK